MPRAKKLPSGDYIYQAPGAVGEQVNVNHENCTAGYDRKARLYIKRTEAGVVAYCHNCGMGGYYIDSHIDGTKTGRVRRPKHVEIDPDASGTQYTLAGFGGAGPVTTKENLLWLHKFLAPRSNNRLVLTAHSLKEMQEVDGKPLVYFMLKPGGDIYGYQMRWTDGRLPKTKTYLNQKPHRGGWYGSPNADKVIIVEDPLSALILSAEVGTKYRIHCLFGTKLSGYADGDLSAMQPSHIVIWLDPDKAGKEAAKELYKRLRFLLPEAVIHELTGIQFNGELLPQPKECFTISEVLNHHV